jgi:hypothetical protein
VSDYALASPASTGDFTFGTTGIPGAYNISNPGVGVHQNNNSELISILMAWTTLPNGVTVTNNVSNSRNPQRTQFLNAKMNSSTNAFPGPGIGLDGVYRDPWGNPYIITVDLNFDNICNDAFYRLQSVSQVTNGLPNGYNGLFNNYTNTGATDDYVYSGKVMVWSFGPDGTADSSVNATANNSTGTGNTDNVLSWK